MKYCNLLFRYYSYKDLLQFSLAIPEKSQTANNKTSVSGPNKAN